MERTHVKNWTSFYVKESALDAVSACMPMVNQIYNLFVNEVGVDVTADAAAEFTEKLKNDEDLSNLVCEFLHICEIAQWSWTCKERGLGIHVTFDDIAMCEPKDITIIFGKDGIETDNEAVEIVASDKQGLYVNNEDQLRMCICQDCTPDTIKKMADIMNELIVT